MERLEANAALDVFQPTGPVRANSAEGDGFPHNHQPLPGSGHSSVEQLQGGCAHTRGED